MPYLADSEACTSCGLCSDMCPDWAVYLTEVGRGEAGMDRDGPDGAEGELGGTSEPANHARE